MRCDLCERERQSLDGINGLAAQYVVCSDCRDLLTKAVDAEFAAQRSIEAERSAASAAEEPDGGAQ